MGNATMERLGQRERARFWGRLRSPIAMLGYQAHNSGALGGEMEPMGAG